MLTNEQIQEAKSCSNCTFGGVNDTCWEANPDHPAKKPEEKICDKWREELKDEPSLNSRLSAALDEIERLQSWLKRIAGVNPSSLDGEDAECMRTWAIRALVGEKVEEL
jgi:hypothetical protein